MVHAWNVEKKERKEECSWVQEKKKKKRREAREEWEREGEHLFSSSKSH